MTVQKSLRWCLLFGSLGLGLAQPPGGGPPGGGGGSGDGIWRRNAYYGEILTFDSCVGHQPGNGSYHYHASPLCLRAQLNDNLQILRTSRNGSTYAELASGWHHSPILGWAPDGYPIYGPYGYSKPLDSTSPIKRLKSGFRLRSITQRNTLPDWSLPNHTGVSQSLTSSQYGPAVSTTFPLGRYVEDFEWVSGLGDLDQYNGRMTVTPEYPGGTYAYYVTIDDNGTPAFPYIIAGEFYGTVTSTFSNGGTVSSSALDYFNAGTSTAGPSTPTLTSWSTKYSTQYAQVTSGFDPSAGPSTTWPGTNTIGAMTSGSVTTPALAEAQRIRYTDSTVYYTSNGLAGYQMGPWFSADMTGGVFVNFPSAQSNTFQIPRTPAAASTRTSTGMGTQGVWVNGVVLFNFLDGATYTNSTGLDSNAGNTPALDAYIASAASLEQGPQAPGSLVSAFPLFFSVLSTSTDSATSPTWPTTLGGATVTVKDSAGTSAVAQIFYASPTQLNFRMPTGLAAGAGTVTIAEGGNTITSKINIQPVYPNLFMLNSNALAAATITRSHNGTVTNEQVYQVSNGSVVASPIALNGDTVYLVVYGSGMGSATTATATIGGVPATVAYAGAQGTYQGLDQFNIVIPASLAGKGKVDVVVTAGGKPSNPVNITIQ
jgi:uncharacterized protein (TIGR03437 family)